MSKILFISNGHGEDCIALNLINALSTINKTFDVFILPMVGLGNVFINKGLNVIGPQKETESGGFIKSFGSFFGDLVSGVFLLHFKQIRNAAKHDYDFIVCVGDFLPVILSVLFLRSKKIFFVSTAKSDLFERHYAIERYFFRKAKVKVFARDSITADNLLARGVDANYLGNVMMDGIKARKRPKLKEEDKFILGILPGSRKEAYENYNLIKDVIGHLPGEWFIQVAVPNNMEKAKFLIKQRMDSTVIVEFNKLLKDADAVIGLAGTANEQVIGCGIPLFTFPAYGPQTTRKRFSDQRKLLAGLPEFIDSQDSKVIAKTIVQKINNSEFLQRVGVNGPKVMGKSGAAEKIVKEILH